jgi:aminopeptidase N
VCLAGTLTIRLLVFKQFGNLVTMTWWDELWLNEGFATWAGYLAVDHLFPEWDVWTQFAAEDMQEALDLDSLRASHPIKVPVPDGLDVDSIFDGVSYSKGGAVVKMMTSFVGGTETFLKGVSAYLKEHAYGTVTDEDLWRALGEASGRDVSSFMSPWIKKIGFPVVSVEAVDQEPERLTVRQRRFLSLGHVKPGEDMTVWPIPVSTSNGSQSIVDRKEATMRRTTDHCILNEDLGSFYRTNFSPGILQDNVARLHQLPAADRIELLSDVAALAVSGYGSSTTATVLSLLNDYREETNCHVWTAVLDHLQYIQHVFSCDEQVKNALDKFAIQLVSPALDAKSWTKTYDSSNELAGRLEAMLFSTAGLAGRKDIVEKSLRLFDEAFVHGKEDAIAPSLREAVFKIVVKHGKPDAIYQALKSAYEQEDADDVQSDILEAFGQLLGPQYVHDALKWALYEGDVDVEDLGDIFEAFSRNPDELVQQTMWNFLQDQWDPAIRERVGGSNAVLNNFIRDSLSGLKSVEGVEEFLKDTKVSERVWKEIIEMIQRRRAYGDRDMGVVRRLFGL